MFRNYILIALRNVFRQKGYSLINVSGLAIGIVSCLFIVLYIVDEFKYDRFHEKGERIYRLFFDYTSPNGETFSHAIGPYRLADELGAGSSDGKIILLITNEFSLLVLIANLIAWPVAWYFMRNWLTDFPYRITIGIPLFLISTLLALLIALITVTYQGWRAATRNPVDSLRYE